MVSRQILPTFGKYMQLRESSILIVDDDQDVLTAVRLLLRPLVKTIEFSRYPDELKSLLKQKDFDVILYDMNFMTISTQAEANVVPLIWKKKSKN